MKKRQLSQKKISVNVVEKSQTRISSFFTKIPKPGVNDNKTISDESHSSANAINKKRKERDQTSGEERANDKKKCTTNDRVMMSKDCSIVKTEKIRFCDDSVLLPSVLKDFDNARNDCKENKVRHKHQNNASPQKLAKGHTKAVLSPVRNERDGTILQNSASAGNLNLPSAIARQSKNQKIRQKSPDITDTVAETIHPGTIKFDPSSKLSQDALGDLPDSITDPDEFGDLFDEEWHAQKIDFTTLQRCRVLDVIHEARVTVLRVQHAESESVDTVACSGFWRDVRTRVGDVVVIQATKQSQQWIVDNNNGLLVTQPDTLISGTTITSGLFCSRRAVLAERFRKVESLPCRDGDYTMMTVGSLVHQWLQKALRENVHALSDVMKLLDDILRSPGTMEYLYASEMTFADCKKRMLEYAPRIHEFIQHYVVGNRQRNIAELKDNFAGSICDIRDIEENVYVPKLGMKGRIDVTAQVSINSKRRTMPLEVKTGRASYSFEHKGQVILYLMMMGFRDTGEVDTGLLLYLKENAMQEIRSNHHEKRDLMLLRNTLAHYFTVRSDDPPGTSSDLRTMELPGPISHHSACVKCPYQTLCCTYLARDPDTILPPSHPLTPLMRELLERVEPGHLDYVVKWIALLQLEESYDNSRDSNLSNLWTMSAEKREARGTCICNLKVLGKVVRQDDRYQHTFARVDIKGEIMGGQGTFRSGGSAFNDNDYVIVNTDARVNIASGHVTQVSTHLDTVTVLLDRDVTCHEEARSIFHIDKYHSTGLFAFNYANLAGLLSDDELSVKLRRIVIDRRPARFTAKLPRTVVSTSAAIISDLNEDQQRAVLRAVAAEEYVLIKGMPGTGKTRTLVALVELLLALGRSVLITAHTHSAVDNVLLKLLERNVDFLRLGATRQIHPLLTCKSEEYAIATAGCDSPDSLADLYNGKRVVGVTCLGAYHALLRRRVFDVCLVDESAQIMLPTVLRPLYSAHRFVLVGDPDQLPPVVRNRTAVRHGADESLFVRLDNSGGGCDGDDDSNNNNTVSLSRQYRMNGRIMRLANSVTYRDKLVAGSRQVENATLTGENMERILPSGASWIRNTLSRNLQDSVVLLDTGSTYNLSVEDAQRDEDAGSDRVCVNVWEAGIVSRLVQVLLEAGVHARNIGVVAPYNAQINLLRKTVDKGVEVNTVDQYQGRDKDVILYSCTKSMAHDTRRANEFEILEDQRRLTVAITRARHKLIIIADKVTLARYTPFRKLFDVIDERNVISLRDSEDGFSWKDLIRGTSDGISHAKEIKKED